ncbi:MAG TPA: acetyl-CoA carboxylase biotin carboxyl carrier protein [Pyrinomonadaceae bacterium]
MRRARPMPTASLNEPSAKFRTEQLRLFVLNALRENGRYRAYRPAGSWRRMSDQETTSSSPSQSSSDERPQQKTNQPERGQHRDRGRRRHPAQNQPQQQQQQHRRAEPTLNMEELRELVELIAQHGFTDFELEREGIRVRLRRELPSQATASTGAASSTAPAPPVPQAPPVQPATETRGSASAHAATTASQPPAEPAKTAAAPEEDLHIITSPIVGTFYRSPSPQSEPFVRIGSHVGPDTVVCIIEAMKLMNEIQAETTGEVAKIYVENGQPVEFGQPLYGIKK